MAASSSVHQRVLHRGLELSSSTWWPVTKDETRWLYVVGPRVPGIVTRHKQPKDIQLCQVYAMKPKAIYIKVRLLWDTRCTVSAGHPASHSVKFRYNVFPTPAACGHSKPVSLGIYKQGQCSWWVCWSKVDLDVYYLRWHSRMFACKAVTYVHM